jgi:L-iditol 2-dehydrogenase
MKTAYLVDTHKIEIVQMETPVIGKNEVLIQVKGAGICGSDIHAFHGTHPFRTPPMTLGHEVAGVIVSVGEDVTRLKVGERVTVEPQKFCGQCSACGRGLYNLCHLRKTPGVGEWLGTFAEYFVAPEEQVYPLPEGMDYEVGLLAEPLAVGVHALRLASVASGFTAAVLGTGPIGLLAAVAAQESGAAQVFCSDVNRYRLQVAQELGLQSVQVQEEDLEEVVKQRTGEGCDVAIVTVSSPKVVNQALKIVRRGGHVIVISVFGSEISFDMSTVQLSEINVKGSMVYNPDDFKEAMNILERRHDQLKTLVTHQVNIEEVAEAFRMLDKPEHEAIKVMIKP